LNAIGLHGEDMERFLSDLARQVHRGNALICVDEAHIYLRQFTVPDIMVSTIRNARHIGLDVCIVTHRLQDISTDIRVVITDIFLFKTHGATNLDPLKKEFISDETTLENILTLKRWHFYYINRKTGEIKLCPPI